MHQGITNSVLPIYDKVLVEGGTGLIFIDQYLPLMISPLNHSGKSTTGKLMWGPSYQAPINNGSPDF
jgi:hypothetical protein